MSKLLETDKVLEKGIAEMGSSQCPWWTDKVPSPLRRNPLLGIEFSRPL